MLWALLLLLVGGLAVAISLGDAGTLGSLDGSQIAALVGSIALLIFIGAPFFAGHRGEISKSLKDLVVWVGLIMLLVLGYSFRDDAKYLYQRIAGELLPPGHTLSVTDGRTSNQRAVRIRKQPNGHFTARSTVNGHTIMMLVDTGASTIVLRSSDARAAGISVDQLKYTTPVSTANGVAFAAITRIRSISVGSIEVRNINVMVSKPGVLTESLLGMNFLTRLRSYEFSGDFLTLRG